MTVMGPLHSLSDPPQPPLGRGVGGIQTRLAGPITEIPKDPYNLIVHSTAISGMIDDTNPRLPQNLIGQLPGPRTLRFLYGRIEVPFPPDGKA